MKLVGEIFTGSAYGSCYVIMCYTRDYSYEINWLHYNGKLLYTIKVSVKTIMLLQVSSMLDSYAICKIHNSFSMSLYGSEL